MASPPINAPIFGDPPRRGENLHKWLEHFLSTLDRAFRNLTLSFPAALRGEMRVNTYVVATKPAAATAGNGAIICVSDGAGGAQFLGSVGGAWVNLG